MTLQHIAMNELANEATLCRVSHEMVESFKCEKQSWKNCWFVGVGLKNSQFTAMEIKYSRFEKCYLRDAKFDRVDLTGTEFVECNLRKATFQNSQLWYASFIRCDLSYDSLLMNLPNELSIRRELLRNLRLNALSMGEIRQADQLLILEMAADAAEQWNILLLATPWHKERYTTKDRLTALYHLIIHTIERLIWGYGIRLQSIIIAAMLFVLLSSATLHLSEATLKTADSTAAPQSFTTCLYFVIITFATVGYGDIVPTSPLARMLMSIVAIFGPVFFGLFVAAAYRRIQR